MEALCVASLAAISKPFLPLDLEREGPERKAFYISVLQHLVIEVQSNGPG